MRKMTMRCIDVNSAYCPCILATMNHCVMCSQLQGKTNCTCNWSGTCVLYETYWQRGSDSSAVRREESTRFTSVKAVGDHTVLATIAISAEFATLLDKAGAFVFLRRANDAMFYHFPVGVMAIEDNELTVAIETVGVKSERLLADTTAELIVRGPYYNGVFGEPWLTSLQGERAVLLAGGIGQAPAIAIAKRLIQGGNHVTAILAKGKIGAIFADERLKRMGVEVVTVPSMRQEGMLLLEKILQKGVDFVASCGSDNQHCGIIAILHEMGIELPMIATNNAVMCCGEGICGSCQHKTKDGRMVKLCKMQMDFRQLEPE